MDDLRRASALVTGCMLAFLSLPAAAGNAEVRDAAIQNGCLPKKIDVLRQSLGVTSETIYQIECNLPKAKETVKDARTNVLIRCAAALCEIIR